MDEGDSRSPTTGRTTPLHFLAVSGRKTLWNCHCTSAHEASGVKTASLISSGATAMLSDNPPFVSRSGGRVGKYPEVCSQEWVVATPPDVSFSPQRHECVVAKTPHPRQIRLSAFLLTSPFPPSAYSPTRHHGHPHPEAGLSCRPQQQRPLCSQQPLCPQRPLCSVWLRAGTATAAVKWAHQSFERRCKPAAGRLRPESPRASRRPTGRPRGRTAADSPLVKQHDRWLGVCSNVRRLPTR